MKKGKSVLRRRKKNYQRSEKSMKENLKKRYDLILRRKRLVLMKSTKVAWMTWMSTYAFVRIYELVQIILKMKERHFPMEYFSKNQNLKEMKAEEKVNGKSTRLACN